MKKDPFRRLELTPDGELPLCPLCGSKLELWEEERAKSFVKFVCCSNTTNRDADLGGECPFYLPSPCLKQPTKHEAISVFMDKAMPDTNQWVKIDDDLICTKEADSARDHCLAHRKADKRRNRKNAKRLKHQKQQQQQCEVINSFCEHHSYQTDRNGDIAITYCNHSDNPDNHEGNCNHASCPITGKPGKDFS